LVREHAHVAQRLAAGLSALPRAGDAFSSVQAAWRFFQNEAISLQALVEPLRTCGRRGASASASDYVLVVHDWSKLSYDHTSKKDLVQLPGRENWGYDLSVALLVDAEDGGPLAPMELELHCARGVHSTRQKKKRSPVAHIDQVLQTMKAAKKWQLSRIPVHVVDSEADGLAQYREWSRDNHHFVIRADDIRCVRWEGERMSLKDISRLLEASEAFVDVREVSYHGRKARQLVAEAEVVLQGSGRKRTPDGRINVPGAPLTLRLVIAQVRDENGRLLATWLLLTNLPASVGAESVSLWYYWRWRIESFFKLMKSHGQEVEAWLQHDGLRIAKRLLIAAMSCTTVWQLQHDPSPAAREMETVLVKISGRLTKRRRPVTTPALLAGLQSLLSVLLILEDYTPDQLRRLLLRTAPMLIDSG
jgi:hypothetical protein